jgi:hypothetical protein
MQRFTFRKTVSLTWILLLSSLMFSTPLTRVEAVAPRACPCTLAWNNSPDATVAGYAIYYGIIGSATTNRLDVGMTNVVTLKNLLSSLHYFFYVAAYNRQGIEGRPSDVMPYTPKILSSVQFARLADGTANLRFRAPTGAVCHVEYTATLQPVQWQTLAGTTADANGNVTLTDPLSGRPPSRYYRVVVP